jgi:hypothetical protein
LTIISLQNFLSQIRSSILLSGETGGHTFAGRGFHFFSKCYMVAVSWLGLLVLVVAHRLRTIVLFAETGYLSLSRTTLSPSMGAMRVLGAMITILRTRFFPFLASSLLLATSVRLTLSSILLLVFLVLHLFLVCHDVQLSKITNEIQRLHIRNTHACRNEPFLPGRRHAFVKCLSELGIPEWCLVSWKIFDRVVEIHQAAVESLNRHVPGFAGLAHLVSAANVMMNSRNIFQNSSKSWFSNPIPVSICIHSCRRVWLRRHIEKGWCFEVRVLHLSFNGASCFNNMKHNIVDCS